MRSSTFSHRVNQSHRTRTSQGLTCNRNARFLLHRIATTANLRLPTSPPSPDPFSLATLGNHTFSAMAPFRNRDRSSRLGRGQIEHNVLEGLPINQYREVEITIGPNSTDNKPLDKDAWPELPMPRDSQMLPEHSQQLLRAARAGRVYKPPVPPEDDIEMKDEEEENKDVQTGFTIKKYVKIARHLETPEPEYLAKRRKGLPSQYSTNGLLQPALRETMVKKTDAEGNVAIYKVLVPEGQSVEGEVQPTDAAIEAAPATAAPGTVVEGVGVVNAEGVVVASEVVQPTPARRKPAAKKKRGAPGRAKKRVVFAEGAAEQGTPVSNAGSDLLPLPPNVKHEMGSVEPSDGDTPMAEAGADDEEGSGEEGSDDDEHDAEHPSAPATPSKASEAPISVPAPDPKPAANAPVDSEPKIEQPLPALTDTVMEEPPAPVVPEPEQTEDEIRRDKSSSPDLPLSTVTHSRQNSLNQIPATVPTTDITLPDADEVQPAAQIVEPDSEPAIKPIPEAEPVAAPSVTPESVPEQVSEPAVESTTAPAPDLTSITKSEPVQASADDSAPPEPSAVVTTVEVEAASLPPAEVAPVPAPESEPDLLGSLERHLEKDSTALADA